MIAAFCVAVCVIVQCSALHEKSADKTIYMIEEELYTYIFSCASGQFIGLSADQRTLLFYDIKKQLPDPVSVSLPLPGYLVQLTADGKSVAVVQSTSYVTIVRVCDHNATTLLLDVDGVSSMALVEGLVCLFPAFNQQNPWVQIKCWKTGSFDTKTCKGNVYGGSNAYVNTVKGWVYLEEDNMWHKFKVSAGCLASQAHSNLGAHWHLPQRVWFSYDGTRIFLESGSTLTSSDDYSDLTPRGDFNGSYDTWHYSYFSQSSKHPNTIAGIRSDMNHTVYYYSWPNLMPIGSKPIPVPPGSKTYGAEEVHICDETDTVYAIVKFAGNKTRIGVVTLS